MARKKRRLPDECEACGDPLELDEDGDCIYCGAEGGKAQELPPPAAIAPPERQGGQLKRWFWPVLFFGIVYYQRGQIEDLEAIVDDAHSQAFENERTIRELRDMMHSHE